MVSGTIEMIVNGSLGKKGTHVIFEGINASGKTTMSNGIRDYLTREGKKVLDADSYAQKHNKFPDENELKKHDIIMTAEPTRTYIGKAIRETLISGKSTYNIDTIAHAYAADREVHYREIVLRALEQGKHVIQSRSIFSFLLYQILLQGVPKEEAMHHPHLLLPGNKLALAYPPDAFFVPTLSVEIAMERHVKQNGEKGDIYEKKKIQEELANFFGDENLFNELFDKEDILVKYFNVANISEEEAKNEAIVSWKEIADKSN